MRRRLRGAASIPSRVIVIRCGGRQERLVGGRAGVALQQRRRAVVLAAVDHAIRACAGCSSRRRKASRWLSSSPTRARAAQPSPAPLRIRLSLRRIASLRRRVQASRRRDDAASVARCGAVFACPKRSTMQCPRSRASPPIRALPMRERLAVNRIASFTPSLSGRRSACAGLESRAGSRRRRGAAAPAPGSARRSVVREQANDVEGAAGTQCALAIERPYFSLRAAHRSFVSTASCSGPVCIFPIFRCAFLRAPRARESPAVVSSPSHRPDVVAANAAAQQTRHRSRPFHRRGAGARSRDLSSMCAIPARKTTRCAASRLWAGQWTSTISIEPPAMPAAGNSRLPRLFRWIASAARAHRTGLAALGFSAVIATAPTAGAASLLARAGRSDADRIGRVDLTPRLASLPLALLEQCAGRAGRRLTGIGVRTLGDLLALPRDGVARRFGQKLLDEIDRARGAIARSAPAVRRSRALSRPDRIAGAGGRDRGAAVRGQAPGGRARRFSAGTRRRRHALALRPGARRRGADVDRDRPARDPRRSITCMNVLRERLSREQLPDRVEAIRLVSEEIAPLAAKEARLLSRVEQATAKPARSWSSACARGWATMRCRRWRCTPITGRSRRGAIVHRGRGVAGVERRDSPLRGRCGCCPSRSRSTPIRRASISSCCRGPSASKPDGGTASEIGRDYFVGRNAQGERAVAVSRSRREVVRAWRVCMMRANCKFVVAAFGLARRRCDASVRRAC